MSVRRMPRAVVATVASCFMFVCCGDRNTNRATTAAGDSTNVELPITAAGSWQGDNGWRLSAAPAVEIGKADDVRQELSDVVGAAKLRGGGLVVGNRGTNTLLYFNSEGKHVATAGRYGSGPGELRDMAWLQLLHDTFVVYDPRLRRFLFFSQVGEHIRTVPISPRSAHTTLQGVGVFDDGTMLLHAFEHLTEEPGVRSISALLYRYFPESGELDSLGSYLGPEVYGSAFRGSGFFWAPILFGRSTVLAVRGDRYVLGRTDQYLVDLFSNDGVKRSTIGKHHSPVRVTDAHIITLRQQIRQSQRRRNVGSTERGRLSQVPAASTMPAFGSLATGRGTPPVILLGELGEVWVLDMSPPGSATVQWSVFDTSGVHLETLRFPADLVLFQVGANFVLGAARDREGFGYVRVHALDRSHGPALR